MLIIIFGSKGVTMTKQRGQFHCPRCVEKKPYAHRRVRRFFSLYFIPVIPLNLLGEYIECGRCKATYEMEVLDYDPEAVDAEIEAQFERAVKRTMVMMMVADGVVDAEEIKTIREVYGSVAGRELSEQAIHDEIKKAERSDKSLTDQLGELAGNLNSEGKELVIRAAFFVALADGEFHDEERALLTDIGAALQMTPAHVRGTIDSMLEER